MNTKLNFPIYLVSLKQDVVRRKELAQRFPKYYKTFIHIEAVDGRKLLANEYYKSTVSFFQKHKMTMSPAELGCKLSRIKVLESFLNSEEPFALVLENDVIGTDDNLDLIQKKLEFLTENSLLLCGGQEGLKKRYRSGNINKQTGLKVVAKFSYKHIYRTCCYVVSRKSANNILDQHKKSLTLADKWDQFFVDTDIKVYYANILRHPEDLGNSNIEADRLVLKKEIIPKAIF